jgi:type I restriction enzyme S subunit
MRAGRIDYSAARPISAETYALWTRRLKPRFGDLLLAREAPVGPVVRIPREENVAPGQRTVLIRPEQGVDPGYLFALLSSRPIQARLQERAEGSTVPHLNVPDIRNLALPLLPTLSEQQGIARTLAALDEKIESNGRLIEKVQHLSIAYFRSWRSSCNDAVASTFGDFCDVYGGSTPRTDEPSNWGGPHWWATPTDLTALPAPYLFNTSRKVSDRGLTSCSASLHPPGTIFMTSRATIGAFAVNQEACATNQGFICARPRHDRDRWFLFEEMRMRVPEMLDRANGSTFLELSRRNFKEMILQVPSERDLDRLTDEVEPLHRLAAQRSRESRGLAELRDALLPELLSGRIRVPEAGEAVKSALA